METARSFYANNRGSVTNFVYIVAFLLILYLVYTYMLADGGNERYVVQVPITTTTFGIKGNASSAVIPVSGGATKTRFCINYDDSVNNPVPNPILRITEGGDFTFSWWMYISAWDTARMGVIKPIICISDPNVSNLQLGNDSAYLMTTFLYPNETKLGIRFQTRPTDPRQLTWMNNFTNAATDPSTAQQSLPRQSFPVCDIQDIDMQRWLNITCVVSSRVVDIYYDGKLNRSCVLPGPVVGSSGNTPQYANTSVAGGFNGYLNSIFFASSVLTPDRIYSIYQAGPGGNSNFLGTIGAKLGINLTYSLNSV